MHFKEDQLCKNSFEVLSHLFCISYLTTQVQLRCERSESELILVFRGCQS